MDVSGGATVTASGTTVVGGYNTSGGSTIKPTPSTGAASIADPLSSLPAPTVGVCNHTNYNPGSGTLSPAPGVYCGGLTISGGTAAFQAGTYYIEGGGVTFSGGATVTGSNVMFYLTGNSTYSYGSFTVSGGTTVTLSSPTSGTYQGILVYQDRSITSNKNADFSGGSGMDLTGTLYFPTTSVTYSGGTTSSDPMAIIADTVTFSGGSKLTYDSTGTKTGLVTKAVAMVE